LKTALENYPLSTVLQQFVSVALAKYLHKYLHKIYTHTLYSYISCICVNKVHSDSESDTHTLLDCPKFAKEIKDDRKSSYKRNFSRRCCGKFPVSTLLFHAVSVQKKLDHFTLVQNICFHCLNCPAFFTANHENCFGIESRSLFGENKPPFLPAIFHPGVNFINILQNKFFVQTSFWQLFSSYMYVEKAAETTLVWKICK